MEKIFNKIDIFYGLVVMLFADTFGKYWYLFAAFLFLNVCDYITGIIKAKYTHTENSNKGLKGIIKKVGYWLVIAISFFIAQFFGSMGDIIGMDLGFTSLIGYFTLATFIINEMRSILENLVELGVNVPSWLIKGLEAASKTIEDKNKKE